jgi:hypothetical protein
MARGSGAWYGCRMEVLGLLGAVIGKAIGAEILYQRKKARAASLPVPPCKGGGYANAPDGRGPILDLRPERVEYRGIKR